MCRGGASGLGGVPWVLRDELGALRLLGLSPHLQHSRFQQKGPEMGMKQMQDVDGGQAAAHPHPFRVHSETRGINQVQHEC